MASLEVFGVFIMVGVQQVEVEQQLLMVAKNVQMAIERFELG